MIPEDNLTRFPSLVFSPFLMHFLWILKLKSTLLKVRLMPFLLMHSYCISSLLSHAC